MTAPSLQPTRIERSGPERLAEAVVRLLGGHRSRAARFIEHARQTGLSLEDLWCARDEAGRVLATALAVPSPGRTAMIFISPPTPRTAVMAIALVDRACEAMAERGAAIVQSLLPTDAHAERDCLHRGGFRDLATLASMERPMPRRGDVTVPPIPARLRFVPWDPEDRATMIAVLDASYDRTLDCPGLCGIRRTEDILDGHLHSGTPGSDLWTILFEDQRPIGTLLLSPTPYETVELVYLGLAADARGRGLGRLLLRSGLAKLSGRAERTLNLAVDEANPPAVALYRSLGFRTTLRRLALIRPLCER